MLRLAFGEGDLASVVERCCEGAPAPLGLVLVPGEVAETLEPFALLSRAVDEGFRLVVTTGWPAASWAAQCERLFAADVLRLAADQRRRALEQRLADGRLEVIFVERGRVLGSALTLVAEATTNAGPPPLNAKVAAMNLLTAARDAGLVGLDALVRDAREALGIPHGPVSTVSEVRRERAASPLPKLTGGAVAFPPPFARPAPSPPIAPRTAPAVPRARPEDRHAVEKDACLRCGRRGKALDEPCGQPALGRMGMIELD